MEAADELRRRGRVYVAAEAWRRLATMYRLIGFNDEADGCYYQMHVCQSATLSGYRRIAAMFSRYTLGFGYRPYNLVFAMALIIAAFSAILALSTKLSWMSLVAGISDYLAYDSFHDGIPPSLRVVLGLESVLGFIVNATLISLLTRRWFSWSRGDQDRLE
jgi:hypothetical protein